MPTDKRTGLISRSDNITFRSDGARFLARHLRRRPSQGTEKSKRLTKSVNPVELHIAERWSELMVPMLVRPAIGMEAAAIVTVRLLIARF